MCLNYNALKKGVLRLSNIGIALLAACPPTWGQATTNKLTDTADAVLTAVAAFGTLTPAYTTTVQSRQVQFRLRSKTVSSSGGYRLDAMATFVATATAATAGGAIIKASDIGVGITSIVPASAVDLPRTDAIATGFNYDPTLVTASNGLTPYTGAAFGQATLADLASSVKLISGPRIDHQTGNNNSDYLQVTMKFGVLPQYFTPATFSSVITLTISNGP